MYILIYERQAIPTEEEIIQTDEVRFKQEEYNNRAMQEKRKMYFSHHQGKLIQH